MTLSPRDTAIQLAQSSAIPHMRALGDAAGEAARNVIAKERGPLLILPVSGPMWMLAELMVA